MANNLSWFMCLPDDKGTFCIVTHTYSDTYLQPRSLTLFAVVSYMLLNGWQTSLGHMSITCVHIGAWEKLLKRGSKRDQKRKRHWKNYPEPKFPAGLNELCIRREKKHALQSPCKKDSKLAYKIATKLFGSKLNWIF